MLLPGKLQISKTFTGKLLLIILLCLVTLSGCDRNDGEAMVFGNNTGQLQMLRVTGLALSPVFEITQKHFVSTADYSVTKIKLQAWGRQSDAEIRVNGEPLKAEGEFALAVGNNRFTISVTDTEKISDQYQLTIVRLPELKGIVINNS
jgi:hypothetical protein